jgi:hypothetical protein
MRFTESVQPIHTIKQDSLCAQRILVQVMHAGMLIDAIESFM